MRIYTVQFTAVAVTAAQDFFNFTPADDKPIALIGFTLSQTTEVGDAAEEMIGIQVVRGNSVAGSGGSTPTPAPFVSFNDTAAGFTAHVNDTTPASGGTAVTLFSDALNERIPYQMFFPPAPDGSLACPVAAQPQSILAIRTATTPADSVTMTGTAWVAELN